MLLRQGYLMTLALEQPERALAQLEAFRIREVGDRCDELLVAGDTAVVVGVRPAQAALEIAVFHLGRDGALSPRGAFWLRTSAELPATAYAMRLEGERLSLYVPVPATDAGSERYPGIRAVSGQPWTRLSRAESIYGGVQLGAVFHTVITCNLASEPATCEARAVLAPEAPAFFMAHEAVYVWSEETPHGAKIPVMYRIPLADAAPGAVRMQGAPNDALAFDEGMDGILRVFVWLRSSGRYTESTRGAALAVARVPVQAFGAAVPELKLDAYVRLPLPEAHERLSGRFIGEWLVYGPASRMQSGQPSRSQLHIHSTQGAARAVSVALDHTVDRIDRLGRGALISGRGDGGVVLSSLDLEHQRVVDRERIRDELSLGERRVLGVYYQASSAQTGTLALPLYSDRLRIDGTGTEESAQVLFFQVQGLQLEALGSLKAQETGADASGDWASNMRARPEYRAQRVSVLVGQELVEGVLHVDGLTESRRGSIVPPN